MLRRAAILCILPLLFASYAASGDAHVRCYLVDARVHVSLTFHDTRPDGEVWWHDTVTGRTGGTRFVQEGRRLVLARADGRPSEAHLLPDLALVLRAPPWNPSRSTPVLGIALD